MEKRLKVLTLNAWGIAIPIFGSPDRELRMQAIADYLASNHWDIVCLQEVWNFDDFKAIQARVANTLPEAYYFHSGLVGSGVCLFTRGKVTFTMMHRYSLNGYPYYLHHGDWFGGKVCGLARVELNGLKIDVYGTHLHAEYDRENDLYLPHRVLQAFELNQFVNETVSGDVAVVLGNLNLEPFDMGVKLILSNAYLADAFLERRNKMQPDDSDPNGLTCDAPSNAYTCQKHPHYSNGKRIDYILFRGSVTHRMECDTCYTTLGRIPDKPTQNYSDHLAVCATFTIKPVDLDQAMNANAQNAPLEDHMLNQAIELMDKGMKVANSKRIQCKILFGFLSLLFLSTIVVEVVMEIALWTVFMLFARFWLTLLIGFCLLYGMIGLEMEKKSLLAAQDGMIVLKKSKDTNAVGQGQ